MIFCGLALSVYSDIEMLREGSKKIRRALSAPSPRALLSVFKGQGSREDKHLLIGRSRFYDIQDSLDLEVNTDNGTSGFYCVS